MSIIKKTIFLLILILSFTSLNAQEIKKIGKFKDWETIVVTDETAKLCFAQSKPVLQSPKNNVREARLFISFRPQEKIRLSSIYPKIILLGLLTIKLKKK